MLAVVRRGGLAASRPPAARVLQRSRASSHGALIRIQTKAARLYSSQPQASAAEKPATSSGTNTTTHTHDEIPIQHAVVSIFDMFSIGVGPSSSHTVGPMRAAKIFVEDLKALNLIKSVHQVRVDLYGSLALTGVGHGTPGAILMGLEGETPEIVDAVAIPHRVHNIKTSSKLNLRGESNIAFDYEKHMVFHYKEVLPQHPNGMRITCFDKNGDMLATNEFFSIGGGFVVNEQLQVAPTSPASTATHSDVNNSASPTQPLDTPSSSPSSTQNVYYKDTRVDHNATVEDTGILSPDNVKMKVKSKIDPKEAKKEVTTAKRVDSNLVTAALPFHNAESLLKICEREELSIAQVVFRNELQWRTGEEIKKRTLNIWNVMDNSIRAGCASSEEYLPGLLKVKRRAPKLHRKLLAGFAQYAGLDSSPRSHQIDPEPIVIVDSNPTTTIVPNSSKSLQKRQQQRVLKKSLPALDWISMYALAVNEENAAGGRVVTAPTNGAAGTIPAVLKYYLDFICPSPAHAEQDIVEFLLTAAAIGMLYKRGASISAAEMGCQGEVGVACSMAAAAFTAVMGGTVQQVENAAEIGMEHNLGLTCDPPMGLVVIPCIERNALAAVKAITAAQLALHGDGQHRVTLDQVIATMRQTGIDMQSKYKETSEGGLAVNVPVC